MKTCGECKWYRTELCPLLYVYIPEKEDKACTLGKEYTKLEKENKKLKEQLEEQATEIKKLKQWIDGLYGDQGGW